MKKRSVVRVFVAIVGVALAHGCNGGPTEPTSNRSNVTRLELAGPDVIAPGETASYTLTAFLANGASTDATAEAIWTNSMPSAVRWDKPGLATGVIVGEGTIGALFAGRSSVKTVVVTPKGTFRLKGKVKEADSDDRIAGATVTVRSGSSVVETTTGPDGSFIMFGVPPEGELQVRHWTYVEHTEIIRLAEHAAVNINLSLLKPRVSLAGTYTLTIGSTACGGGGSMPLLREDLRRRSYTAVVEQNGNALNVTLTGVAFGMKPSGMANRFFGTVAGSQATFFLFGPDHWYYYYYDPTGPDISEQLEDGTYLVPSGSRKRHDLGHNAAGDLSGSIWQRTQAVGGLHTRTLQWAFPLRALEIDLAMWMKIKYAAGLLVVVRCWGRSALSLSRH